MPTAPRTGWPGLLPLDTSFATRKLHLGYRHLIPRGGPFNGPLMAHEFHYATTMHAKGEPLFDATDAEGIALPPMGLRTGQGLRLFRPCHRS